ncbi:MAG: hypothetical protein WCV99_11135 [Sterolibacterium sp.]|jgi:hypothetical protein
MNSSVLITLLIITVSVLLIGMIAWVCLPPSFKAEALPLPAITDPALPEIQERAILRLLRLPHFRRILDGTVFDYYRGACLEVCECQRLPYPHLILNYGGQQSVVFQTAGALEQYVAVQETVAASLRTGVNSSPSPVTEGR